MKRFTLLLIILLCMAAQQHVAAQCTGALSLSLKGSSTGGDVSTKITVQPATTTQTSLGASFTLSVTATGDNLTYQWSKDGFIISGATAKDYMVNSAQAIDAGDYSCLVHGNCGTDKTTNTANVKVGGVILSLKVFLEGPLSGSTMNDSLRAGGYIKSTQPYSMFSYNGTETVSSSVLSITGNNAIVDWVLVELRSKNAPASVLFRRAALLQSNGNIVDVDGTSPLTFASAQPDDYYIAVRHRNHLGFRTNSAKTLSAMPLVLDFTNGSVGIYGFFPLKSVSGAFAMYSGDANHNGVISASDRNEYWLLQNGYMGYYEGDFNMDGIVRASDNNEFWIINNGRIQQLD